VEAGTEVSFDSYVRARSTGLLRLAWLITRDWDDARDAVQDAFVAVYPRWSRGPRGTGLLPEAIGGRSLTGAACLEGRAVRSGVCAEGGTRWTPDWSLVGPS
jgi:hypothetical protein